MAINKGYLTAKTDKASDEVFTPAYAVKALLPHIPLHFTKVWCPFDQEDSEYVTVLRNAGYTVIASHIDDGHNFFYDHPNELDYDCIISNPPFSIKDDIIKHLWELDKPYAILLPIPALQGQKRFPYIKDCQALIFDKRINYFTNKETKEIQKGASFGSFYLCRNFLEGGDLKFCELEI